MKDRKLQRLRSHDYSKPGLYFVTINIKDCAEFLSVIEKEELTLTPTGKIVEKQWKWLADHYNYIEVDEYVIMPDHFHGIIEITSQNVGNGRDPCEKYESYDVGNGRDRSLHNVRIKPLYDIIGAFKTTSSKRIHEQCDVEFKWQKSFHDRKIRNGELDAIRKYIKENPLRYDEKEFYWSK